MRKAGLKTLAGSALPIANGVPPLHDDLVALVGAGTTSMEALLHHAHVLKCGPRSWRTKVQTALRTEEATK